MNTLLEYINIPKSGKTKQRIPIKEVVGQLGVSMKDKRILTEDIKAIYLVGVLNEQTLRLSSFKNEEYIYETIYVINVDLNNVKHLFNLNEKMHQAFPNPIIAIYHIAEKYMISLALKRINKLDNEKSVIENIYSSNVFEFDDNHVRFKNCLNMHEIKSKNLKEFYELYVDLVYSERIIDLLGYYPNTIPKTLHLKEVLDEIVKNSSRVNSLNEEYKTTSIMSKKMDIHMDILRIKDRNQQMLNQLKEELSNG